MIYFRNQFCVLTQQNKIMSQNEMLNQAFELRHKAKSFNATFFYYGRKSFSEFYNFVFAGNNLNFEMFRN